MRVIHIFVGHDYGFTNFGLANLDPLQISTICPEKLALIPI